MKKQNWQPRQDKFHNLEFSFAQRVLKILVTEFDIELSRAEAMMLQSSFHESLKFDPDFVMHYSAKHWAKEILDEHHVVAVQ